MTKQVTQLFAAKNIAVHTTAHVNFTQNFTLNATLNSTLTAFHTLYTNVYRKHRKHRKLEQFPVLQSRAQRLRAVHSGSQRFTKL